MEFVVAAFVVAVLILARPGFSDSGDESLPASSARDSLRILAPAERATVEGHGRPNWSGEFDASIWNGSACALTGFYYRLVARDSAPGAAPERWQAVSIPPQHSGRVVLRRNDSRGRGGLSRWFVDSVQGRCPASR